MNQKIVLIGAGSFQFGIGTIGNIFSREILKGSTVCLHDIDESALKLIYQACLSAIEKNELDIHVEYTINRKKALKKLLLL